MLKQLAVCCLLSLFLASCYAQQPMCGQSLSPSQANLARPIQGFAIVATPLRAVADPRFQIQFPSRDFFADGAASRGLKVSISGCFTGTDDMATILNDTVTTRPGLFTGFISTDTACTVTVESTNKAAFPNDLKAPSEVFGNFLTPDSNYFVSFSLKILTNALTVMNQGVNTVNRTATLAILDSFNKMSFYGVDGTNQVTTPSNTITGIVVKATPNVAVDVGSAFPADKQLTVTFSQNVFPTTNALTASVSGCATVASAAVTRISATSVQFGVGTASFTTTECIVTISSAAAGNVVIPASNSLFAEMELRDSAGFRLPRMFGRSASQPTNTMSQVAIALSPSAQVRTQLTSVRVEGTPRNALSASDFVQITLRNVIFRNIPTSGPTNYFVLDVDGCATASNLPLTTNQLTASFAQLTTTAAVAFTSSTTKCGFTVRPAASSPVTMNTYEAATTIRATVATSATSQFEALGALNYGEIETSIYSMTNLKIQVSSTKTGESVSSIKLEGTPANNILASEQPEVRVVVPKILSIENTKNYTVTLSGCASFGPSSIAVPDDLSCDAVFSIIPTGGITANTPCTVEIRPASENGGLMRNPSSQDQVIQLSLQTFKQGAVLDFGQNSLTSYNTTVDPKNPNNNGGVTSGAIETSISLAALIFGSLILAL